MDYNDKIHTLLEKINTEVIGESKGYSLYMGKTGSSLFNVMYAKHFLKNEFNSSLTNNIQEIVDNSLNYNTYTLSGGKVGINWLFNFLYKAEYIDDEDFSILCSDDKNLMVEGLKFMEVGNYDFLHGAIGIAYYMLDRPENKEFFNSFFLKLNSFTEADNGIIGNFNFEKYQLEKDKVNLGLAHGICGVLGLALECFRLNICKELTSPLIDKITSFLISNVNEDLSICYFPSFSETGSNPHNISRLGWCYGDLPIAFMLYKSGKLKNNQELIDFSLRIFSHSIGRVKQTENFVWDAGICHGSAGIAHIYHKMWINTGDKRFKDASDFWIEETINYASYTDTISGFKYLNQAKGIYEQDSGLLMGSAGIGLVLISYLTNDFSWDNCIMLN